MFCCCGEIENVQPPLWVTVKVCPPTVMVPVRCEPGFAAAVKRTVPFPLPVAPLAIVSQLALLFAVQAQPSPVLTSNDADEPPAAADADVEESENEHPCPWLIVNVKPAIVSAPERPGPFVDATEKFTVPLPVPLPPDVIVIHG
jgi:hypothetical protein